jgi:hypothetical protein
MFVVATFDGPLQRIEAVALRALDNGGYVAVVNRLKKGEARRLVLVEAAGTPDATPTEQPLPFDAFARLDLDSTGDSVTLAGWTMALGSQRRIEVHGPVPGPVSETVAPTLDPARSDGPTGHYAQTMHDGNGSGPLIIERTYSNTRSWLQRFRAVTHTATVRWGAGPDMRFLGRTTRSLQCPQPPPGISGFLCMAQDGGPPTIWRIDQGRLTALGVVNRGGLSYPEHIGTGLAVIGFGGFLLVDPAQSKALWFTRPDLEPVSIDASPDVIGILNRDDGTHTSVMTFARAELR